MEFLAKIIAVLTGDLNAEDLNTQLTEIITGLADSELGDASNALLDLFNKIKAGEVEGIDARNVVVLKAVGDAILALGADAHIRAEAAAEVDRQIAEIEQAIAPAAPAPEPAKPPAAAPAAAPAASTPGTETPQPPDAGENPPPPEEPAAAPEPVPAPEAAAEPETAPEGDEEPVGEPEAVAASLPQPSLGQVQAMQPPATAPRVPARARQPIIGPGGQHLADAMEIAEAMVDMFDGTSGPAQGSQNFRVARLRTEYPDDRILDYDNPKAVQRQFDAIAAYAEDPANWDEAVTASGGFCAPTQVDYALDVISTAVRPMRDGLPSFQAARGGLRLPTLPTLASIGTSLGVDYDAAVTVWTNTDDTDNPPGPDTKGVQTIDCATFTEFLVAAVVARLRFGNFGARAFPEQVAAWNELVAAAHARVAETRILNSIKAASTGVAEPTLLGTWRDLVEQVARHAAGIRSTHRNTNAMLRVAMPWWAPAVADVDLQRGMQSDPAFLTEGQRLFRQALSNIGVNVTYYVDSPSSGISQIFTGVSIWPNRIQWGIWTEGGHRFLDAGTLDLGIVRDSDLNDQNNFENFMETFEGVASNPIVSRWITSAACPTGESVAGVTGPQCAS